MTAMPHTPTQPPIRITRYTAKYICHRIRPTLVKGFKPVKQSAIEYLRCPVTGDALQLLNPQLAGDSDDIVDGKLISAAGHEYEIVDGVPVLLTPEHFAPSQAETRASFSAKWQTATDYRQNTKHHYVQWYLDRYGFETIDGLRSFLADKRFILEAGTGTGRDAEMYATNSAATVFALDISHGIHAAYRDLAHLPNLHLVQADLTRPPFPVEQFDFVACDQVIHHTPDTRKSFQTLTRYVAPGGFIAVYVYKKKGPVREFCDDFIRSTTTQMTPEECMDFSERITQLGKALAELDVEINVPVDIPILELKAGRYDLQRWIYWNFFKCYWNDTMDWTSNVVTNFDWYHPLDAHRHTPEEVRDWCKEAELEIVHFDESDSGISVLGRRA